MHIMPNNRFAVTLCLFLAAAAPLRPQVKKTEVTKATTPAEDAKGLSAAVPESMAISTKIERVVIVRMKNQSDILAELEKQIRAQKIRNAVILTGAGSAISTNYHVVSNREFPSKNMYVENPTTSADIVNMSGYVMNGRVHAHITFADPDKAYGGHLEARNRVFTFAILTLGVLPDDLDISRLDDKTVR